MSTNKARGNITRRILAKAALIGAAMTVPMIAVAAPAMAAPTPRPGVVQADCDYDFDSGYSNQWTDDGKPWNGHGKPWKGNPWGGGYGKPWGGYGDECGFGGGSSQWFFPPGWFGSS
ncbi:hypothetical protein [Nocardia sp. NPDC049526]|uniref:hypothetical protein n=1 Tax=Nocardia sp. NPDC049526 TaxID=3364316 RepID=UPI0037A03762